MTPAPLQRIAQQEKIRREILHKSDLIPPLPDLVTRLLGLLSRKDTEPAHLEQLLQNDQVLVAKMLAMVNSPFYGLNRTIRTVKEGVMVLGFRGVRSLVLATSAAKFLQRDFGCYGYQPKGLWLHAVCVAAGARHLARACAFDDDAAEQTFVAGLLHDIGKLLLVNWLSDGSPASVTGAECGVERAHVGIDHAEAGALVTARWNLAREVQVVIGAHHDGQDAVHAKAIAVVRLADVLAHERGVGYLPGRKSTVAVRPADLAVLGLGDAAWSALRDELVVKMDEAVLSLGELSS